MKKCTALLLALLVFLSASVPVFAADGGALEPMDYASPENWAYLAMGSDKEVDVFLICPTVDTESKTNSFDLNEKLKAQFLYALDLEKGMYEDTGRLFSPYYRQMAMNAYKLSEEERALAREIAYRDVSGAFRWYLDNENHDRPLILAGFSQGSEICLELMKEYFGGQSAEARSLRERLVAVYAIGWSVTEDMTVEYPQIVPAAGETDTGVVVSFDCEDGTLDSTLVIPEGTVAVSINPLNWKTDDTAADKSLNTGAVMSAGAEPVLGLCGAYLGARGELIVTDVTPEEYPNPIDIFPEGSYHVYDYLFFFTNLKQNVAKRTAAYLSGIPFQDVARGAWYAEAVKYAFDQGLMDGTDSTAFCPDAPLTRAQLVTILWRRSSEPVVNYMMPFTDVLDETWYTEAVRWAASEKLIDSEIGGSFEPNRLLTREETTALLWDYAKYSGLNISAGEDTNLLSYNDVFEIAEESIPAVQWAIGAGILKGTGGGNLDPAGILTRAQAAAMLMRFDAAAQANASPLSEGKPSDAA